MADQPPAAAPLAPEESGAPAAAAAPSAPSGAAGIDVERAIRLNRHYGRTLGWDRSVDQIVALLGFTDRTPDEGEFAESVALWQRKQGLDSDGIIGPKTWSRMQEAIEPPPDTAPRKASPSPPAAPAAAVSNAAPEVNTPLPAEGEGFYSYVGEARRFGTSGAIQALTSIGKAWKQAHPKGPRIGIGDVSFKGGGPMSPHKSHQKGLDVDIRPVRGDGKESPVQYQSPDYSQSLTQELADLITANGLLRVQFIFFNDPNIKGVKPQPGHDNHFHVRFHPA